jgi:very-short-patch-repair endonuclease
MVETGRLHPVHRGVYAVGHPLLRREGHWMAAVLAGGPGAVASHRLAGAVWDVIAWSGRAAVTVPSWRASTRALEFHARILPPDEITVEQGVPVTSVSRTLLDLATVLSRDRLLKAIDEAETRGLGGALSLRALIERHRGQRGVAILRKVLTEAGYGVTKGELEDAFARFIGRRRLPRPERNAWVRVGADHFQADCVWRGRKLIVELHSARFHSTVPKVTRDAGRDRRLAMAGWLVIHVTWAQLHDRAESDALEHDLRRILAEPTFGPAERD